MVNDSSTLKIIAVIPCYNEQKNIYDIVTRTKKYVDRVFVVNDGSTDNTESEAIHAGAEVINHSCNLGKGVALNTAFEFLRDLDCEAAVFLDGDGQHDPAEIPQIIKPILSEEADMVIGSRFINGSDKIPVYRKLGQTVLNIATNMGSRVKVTDSQSGYRSFSRKGIEIMSFSERGLSVESEMQFIAGRNNLIVCEVPIQAIYEGELKRNPIRHGFGVLFRVMRLILLQQNIRLYGLQRIKNS